jgi:hypothetical protein
MRSRTKAVSTSPIEEVCLIPGQIFAIVPKRPHRVTNIGDTSTNFIVVQGNEEFDFAPIARRLRAESGCAARAGTDARGSSMSC